MPLHFPDQIVQSPQILSHLLLVVAIFPCRTHAQLDFPAQIVKSPQVLSHLLLMVALFPLPHPCAIRFPTPNPHKSYLICLYTGKGILASLYYLRRELPEACGKLRRCTARPVTLPDFRGQIPTSPFSFAFKI